MMPLMLSHRIFSDSEHEVTISVGLVLSECTWTVSSLTESLHPDCHAGRRLVPWWQSQRLTQCGRAALSACVLQSYGTVFRRKFKHVAVWKLLNQNLRDFHFVEPLTFDRSQSASASSDFMALYKLFYLLTYMFCNNNINACSFSRLKVFLAVESTSFTLNYQGCWQVLRPVPGRVVTIDKWSRIFTQMCCLLPLICAVYKCPYYYCYKVRVKSWVLGCSDSSQITSHQPQVSSQVLSLGGWGSSPIRTGESFES